MSETRTELGYAWWKEDTKRVAEARVAAKGIVGARKIKGIMVEPFMPLVAWLVKVLP